MTTAKTNIWLPYVQEASQKASTPEQKAIEISHKWEIITGIAFMALAFLMIPTFPLYHNLIGWSALKTANISVGGCALIESSLIGIGCLREKLHDRKRNHDLDRKFEII